MGTFDRYSERGRRVVFFARYEASQFGMLTIEPEHFVLGVLREDKLLGTRIFVDRMDAFSKIRRRMESQILEKEKIPTSVNIPLSDASKALLVQAEVESSRRKHYAVAPVHLLLAALKTGSPLVAQVLLEQGVDYGTLTSKCFDPSEAIKEALETGLSELDLSNMYLTRLPESIGKLSQLTELNLSVNKLRRLPVCLGDLTQLRSLDLAHNELESLPDSLQNLTLLKLLSLRNNKQLGLPPEIVDSSKSALKPAEIMAYYFRLQTGRKPLNEARLILVGRGSVGKTSLVHRLVFHGFNEREAKTQGIQISKWSLHNPPNDDVGLHIWDFGGQEIMHATHQFFLSERSLYLLVLSGREGGEDADAEYWLKLISSFGTNSPVLVILNKINEHPFEINRRALQRKYPSVRGFVKTDCADGTGFKQLYSSIEREAYGLEHLHTPFPVSWIRIKNRLSESKKNYLSFEEYRRLCAELGEFDPDAQEELATYLHILGVALNYKDDPRLQDTHVLNPHWVTNGIYKIINSGKLEEQKGEISLAEIAEILDPVDYPVSMCRFIFDLMKKFDLCFSFPGDDCRYLIPELLDKQEPGETDEFRVEDCLNFEYHYPVLPEGLLPRFVVRTHALSHGMPRWRTGVVLKFEGNRALVKADIQDKKVLIHVAGPLAGRRRLLAIIRSDFERIHRDVRNLQPQEMIPIPDFPNAVVPYDDLVLWEMEGRSNYSVRVFDRIADLSVSELLNGVDLEGAREHKTESEQRDNSVSLFFSYSHKDENLRYELEAHLKLLNRQGLISTWHDRKIGAGDDWTKRIDENLESADLILLLVSADFLASDYCYEKEMARALERHNAGQARLIPIIVRDVSWRSAPFSKVQALPTDGLAITKWSDRDSAWRDVSEGIERVIKQIQKERVLDSE